MLRRSKTSKSEDQTCDDEGKKDERSKYQTYWIVALIFLVGFVVLMNEKKYIMLFHVQQYLGISLPVKVKVESLEAQANTIPVIEKMSQSNKEAITPELDKVVDKVAASAVETIQDSCEWREDELIGRCFGLKKQDGKYPTQLSCQQHCCEVGWDCITYQWREDKGCFIGDIVRLGSENAPTGNWCEPTKPAEWLGKRLASRESSTCKFEEGNLSGQCYGLGIQKPPTSPEGCEKLCCETEKCTVWQFRADKGCFVGKSNNCDKDVNAWSGRRKPTPEWRAKGRERPDDA